MVQPVGAGVLAVPVDLAAPDRGREAVEPIPNDCTQCAPDLLAGLDWLDTAPMHQLAVQGRLLVDEAGGTNHVPPDQIPGYDILSADDQRTLWRIWIGASLADLWAGRGPGFFSGADLDLQQPQQPAVAAAPAVVSDESFGLRSLWRLEGHGYPLEVLPADGDGGFYLVTSRAVLLFPGPGEDPSWMVKPEGFVNKAEAVDINGDGVRDLVMGLRGSFLFFFGLEGEESGDSVVIFDGATGKNLFRGLSGGAFLYDWTLTDVDGDGAVDLLGVDYFGERMTAATTNGDLLWQQEPEGLPNAVVPVVGAAGAFYGLFDYGFGDVDGDGVGDVVVTSFESAAAFVPMVGAEGASQTFVAAYSGVDGSRLWLAPAAVPTRGSPVFTWVQDVADVDGDGTGDPVISYLSIRAQSVAVVTTVSAHSGIIVLSGVNGAALIRDEAQVHTVFPFILPPATVPINEVTGFADTVADLDGDGLDEVIVIEQGATEFDGFLVGRTVGALPGGTSLEDFRVPFELPAYDDGDGMVVLRDVDGDGIEEYVVALMGAYVDEDGELTGMDSRLMIFDDKEVTTVELPRLTPFYDVDPVNGNAYGWTIEDDRFGPLAADGSPIAEGMQMIISPNALTEFDVTGDGIPEILLRKSMGFVWVDGRDGSLLEDVARPAGRYLRAVVPDDDKLYIVETDWNTGDNHLTELLSGKQVWTLEAETLEDAYVYSVADFNGDGSLDALARTFGRGDQGPAMRVIDVAKSETIWEVELPSGFVTVTVTDLIPSRAGKELVMNVFGGLVCTFTDNTLSCETDDTVEEGIRAYTTDAPDPAWKLVNDDEVDYWYAGNADGLVLVTAYEDEAGVLIVDGANGTTARAVKGTEDATLYHWQLLDVAPATGPELLLVHAVEGEGEETRFRLEVTGARDGTQHSEFALAADLTGSMGYVFGLGAVGDWTGDEWQEVAFMVFDQPVVFDGRSGDRLAAAATGTSISFAEDFNNDGVPELGVMDSTLRLRLFTYDQAINRTGEDEGDLRVLEDPSAPQTDAGAEEFFADRDTPGLSPMAALFAVAGALAAAAASRRNRRT